MKTTLILFTLCLLVAFTGRWSWSEKTPKELLLTEAWNPHAGYIAPYSYQVIQSSNPENTAFLSDQNPKTAWESAPALPTAYFTNKGQNVLLSNPPLRKELSTALDGNMDSALSVPSFGNTYQLRLVLPSPVDFLSLKAEVTGAISIEDEAGNILASYSAKDNYQVKSIPLNQPHTKLMLSAMSPWQLFEIGAMLGAPKEEIVLDLGKPQPVGQLRLQPLAEAGQTTIFHFAHADDAAGPWRHDTTYQSSKGLVIAQLPRRISTRYLRVSVEIPRRDWAKARLFGIEVYDEFGPYGNPPPAKPSKVSLGELLGVNGYWSWGTNEYSNRLPADKGPLLYAPLVSHARNYHDLTWDVKDPDRAVDFAKMAAGGGTEVNEWLNWDQEYTAWTAAGISIQGCLQFQRFEARDWQRPYESAYAYGAAFAKHFGPTHGNGLIRTIEVGNEPWYYPASVYQKILAGALDGIKATDAAIEVFPCALQAYHKDAEEGYFKNYLGDRITPEIAEKLDGINVHAYSHYPNFSDRERAVHPEHPGSNFREIVNAVRWREANMPDKKLLLSEWGWDHGGGCEDCTHPVCVGESAAAAYALRGALFALRLGYARASWFFYANEDKESSIYSRSGLTGSVRTGFKPKATYFAFQQMQEQLGEAYFLRTIREDADLYAYLMADKSGEPSHLIYWLPKDYNEKTRSESFTFKYEPKVSYQFSNTNNEPKEVESPRVENGRWQVIASPIPTIVKLQ